MRAWNQVAPMPADTYILAPVELCRYAPYSRRLPKREEVMTAPKPGILMMDEATSALDNLTQKHVSEALDRMNCTRIVIAHRLSTIRQCDRIIMLEDGKIIEDGTYEELLAKNGKFAEMVARQQC